MDVLHATAWLPWLVWLAVGVLLLLPLALPLAAEALRR